MDVHDDMVGKSNIIMRVMWSTEAKILVIFVEIIISQKKKKKKKKKLKKITKQIMLKTNVNYSSS